MLSRLDLEAMWEEEDMGVKVKDLQKAAALSQQLEVLTAAVNRKDVKGWGATKFINVDSKWVNPYNDDAMDYLEGVPVHGDFLREAMAKSITRIIVELREMGVDVP